MQARQQVLTIFVSSSAAAAIGASAADAVDTSPPDSGCEKTAAAPLSAVASRKLRREILVQFHHDSPGTYETDVFFEANTTHQTERQCFPPAFRLWSCVDRTPRGG